MDTAKKLELEKFATEIRIATLEALGARGFGHIGGSMSIADALAVLYGDVMRVDPANPAKPDRDKLVCSKGHAGPAVYGTLALKGYFPREDLKTLNQPGTRFPSHCDRNKTPGVDMTTGSLGQGTSLAAGMALADKLHGYDSRTFVIVGDGEADEGQVWEAAMFASAKKLTNLTFLLDWNKKQLDGYVKDVLDTGDFSAKFAAFGFEVLTINGNDIEELYNALHHKATDKPIAIVMNTVKGAGIPEVEQTMSNHSMNFKPGDCDRWIAQLQARLEALA